MNKTELGYVIEKSGRYMTDPFFIDWEDDISKAVFYSLEGEGQFLKNPTDVIPWKPGKIHEGVNYDELKSARLIKIERVTTYKLLSDEL